MLDHELDHGLSKTEGPLKTAWVAKEDRCHFGAPLEFCFLIKTVAPIFSPSTRLFFFSGDVSGVASWASGNSTSAQLDVPIPAAATTLHAVAAPRMAATKTRVGGAGDGHPVTRCDPFERENMAVLWSWC